MKVPWYVLTGGPSAGKTTVLEVLQRRGYTTVPEAARTVIERELASGKTLTMIRADEAAFQKGVFDLKIQTERELPRTRVLFLDRGMPDTVAYLRASGFPVWPEVSEACRAAEYARVFVLDPVPFVADHARSETPEEALRIDQELERAYRELGNEVVRVPVMPIEARADFVLSHI